MKSKHTPAPWYPIQYANYINIQTKDEYAVGADVLNLEDNDRAEANAKLAASAPDMLEVLLKMEPQLERLEKFELIEEVRNVIKKATL